MTTVGDATAPLPFTGTAPYGTCFHQASANLLAAAGLPEADRRLGLSWGFSWDGHSPALRAADRWREAAGRLYRFALEQRDHERWEDALDAERSALAAGQPVVVGVDAFHIPSPQQGVEHLPHALIVHGFPDDGVVVVDPMNRPVPQTWDLDFYRQARDNEAGRRRTLILRGEPAVPASEPLLVVGALLDAVGEWGEDLAALNGFLDGAQESAWDVADVAGERLYLAKALERLAGELPASEGLSELARAASSLSQRWYFLETMIREARSTGLQPGRAKRLGTQLRDRELAAVATAREVLAQARDDLAHTAGKPS